jgi:hypothetical protein
VNRLIRLIRSVFSLCEPKTIPEPSSPNSELLLDNFGLVGVYPLPIHSSLFRNRPCNHAEREDDRAHRNDLGAR